MVSKILAALTINKTWYWHACNAKRKPQALCCICYEWMRRFVQSQGLFPLFKTLSKDPWKIRLTDLGNIPYGSPSQLCITSCCTFPQEWASSPKPIKTQADTACERLRELRRSKLNGTLRHNTLPWWHQNMLWTIVGIDWLIWVWCRLVG